MKTHPVVHFDIPAKNTKRAQKFYQELFGWTFKKMMFGVDYWFINVVDENTPNGEKNEGFTVHGGMTPRFEESHRMVVYIHVDSVDDYSEKVMKLGGKVLVPKTTVPRQGYFAYCEDTEDNMFALWEDMKE